MNGITPQCMDLMVNYPWPGNIRELENAIERGVILMRGDYLDEGSLPITIQKWSDKNPAQGFQPATPQSLEDGEKVLIARTLEETAGNKSETARRLNITRKTLLNKLKKYQINK